MSDDDVVAQLAYTKERFHERHRDLEATWTAHVQLASRRMARPANLEGQRALLMGAYFTREFSLEGAALFNPSMVAHPDQSGLASGELRFVMSLRAVGEGHISSIEFRTGTIGAAGDVRIDEPSRFASTGQQTPGPYERKLFHAKLAEHGCDNHAAGLVLDALPPHFGPAELAAGIAAVSHDLPSRSSEKQALGRIQWVAENNYTVEFPAGTPIAERVLWPRGPAELQGMEDARFVRFTDDGGAVTYLATYTAFDQLVVAPQLISTDDFQSFRVSQLSGALAANKGMAVFPRKVGGKYVSLSRWDREHLAVTTSDDMYDWSEGSTLEWQARPWELVQVGNCGSPIETPEGWLVLTHGVGPMREYGIGAILLDLEDPGRVISSLPEPLLVPEDDEREGYVPNVVYSCGALVSGSHLVLPYGFSDSGVGFALVELADLVDRLAASAVRGP